MAGKFGYPAAFHSFPEAPRETFNYPFQRTLKKKFPFEEVPCDSI